MDGSLNARLERLEGQLRRWKMFTIVLLVGLVALIMAGPAVSQQNLFPFDDRGSIQVPANKLAAHDFTLVGKDGQTYGRLFMKGNTPVLEFYNDRGEPVWSTPPSHGGYKPVGEGMR
jgi:hypothetical protein